MVYNANVKNIAVTLDDGDLDIANAADIANNYAKALAAASNWLEHAYVYIDIPAENIILSFLMDTRSPNSLYSELIINVSGVYNIRRIDPLKISTVKLDSFEIQDWSWKTPSTLIRYRDLLDEELGLTPDEAARDYAEANIIALRDVLPSYFKKYDVLNFVNPNKNGIAKLFGTIYTIINIDRSDIDNIIDALKI